METVGALRQLFTYNKWANRRVLDSLVALPNHSPQAVRLFAHLLIAEKMWLARLLNNEDTTGFDFWKGETLAECEALLDENEQKYTAFFENLTDKNFNSVATYKNSKGIEYRNTYRDMLMHALFHSAYHRGQVAQATRADGSAPAYTDYIAYVRESEAGSYV